MAYARPSTALKTLTLGDVPPEIMTQLGEARLHILMPTYRRHSDVNAGERFKPSKSE